MKKYSYAAAWLPYLMEAVIFYVAGRLFPFVKKFYERLFQVRNPDYLFVVCVWLIVLSCPGWRDDDLNCC